MAWLRHTVIDIAVLVVIVLATFGGQVWALWIVRVYTPLMVLLKAGALAGGVTGKGNDVPDWFYHAVYALSVLLLLYHQEYWLAGGWVVIWLLSVVATSRSRAPTPTKQ